MIGAPGLANAPITTTTTVTASVNAVSGDVRIGALVSACAPNGAPNESGTVQFFDGTTPVASFTLCFPPLPNGPTPCSGGSIVSNGGGSVITLPAVSPGTHSYT